jgi:hypothetical protein
MARRLFSLFAGVMFLNLSFFLSGISLLYPDNKQMVENVAKLVINEEEKDTHGSETDRDAKVFPLFHDHMGHLYDARCVSEKLHPEMNDPSLPDGHAENFSPPPEFQHWLA